MHRSRWLRHLLAAPVALAYNAGMQTDARSPALLRDEDPAAVAITAAIRGGDHVTLRSLLQSTPTLTTGRIRSDGTNCGQGERTLLHVATDWPGNFPNVAGTIAELVAAGADPNARFVGAHAETPLHWAASCDDVAALDALLDAGADIEADGAVIGGGTPLDDACAFRQWRAAERLVERGAACGLGQAASLGMLDRVQALLRADPGADAETLSDALWMACHGGRQACAEFLLAQGADPNWLPPWEPRTALDEALQAQAPALADSLRAHGARTAAELGAG